jgi:hypothetical protein
VTFKDLRVKRRNPLTLKDVRFGGHGDKLKECPRGARSGHRPIYSITGSAPMPGILVAGGVNGR